MRDRSWTGAVARSFGSLWCSVVWCRGGGSVLEFEVVWAVVYVWGTGRVWIVWFQGKARQLDWDSSFLVSRF